jgi:amino acid adenylation domain-containing protein
MSLTPKTQIESIYPLSPMQQGMLFHTLYAPNSGVYFVQSVFTLSGNLNVLAFEQAWRRVIELHPILRTLFVWKNRQHPLQVVCKSVNLPWNNNDWRSLSSEEQEESLLTFLQAERERGFELDKAPLMRCTLIRVADNTYQFIWSHHHLLIDGWCLSIVLKEVWAFYQAFDRGENLYLNAPPPYRNYIAWLRQQDSEASQKFWRSTLAGFTAPTPLVVDKLVGNLSQQKDIYDEQNFKLSASLTDALKELVRQNHLTLNTLVQGAWALLLSRYSGESDVVFGATVSGRPPALLGVESMVGLFINTLPVRVQVSPETELLSWLKQLQVSQVEREQYSYSLLVEIQGVSDVPRNLPLFNSIVVFENYPVDSSLLEGKGSIEISNVRGFERTNYPLTVVVVPDKELFIQISYDTNRFDNDAVSRMLGHLQTLLSGIVANPQGRVCELPMLTEREKQQLLVEWNNTLAEYPQDKCIHQLFEEQVIRSPDAVAVVFEGEQLTYRELNARANQLAHYLQSLRVEPETLVGICVERSLEMVVGLLSILKAGGAYVPIDPAYPEERIAYILDDSQLPVLLTQKKLVASLPEHQARVVCLDSNWEEISTESELSPITGVTPENFAYIIYTSGSTGKPKGVQVAHRGLCNLATAQIKLFDVKPVSRILQFASISFDASIWEIVMALCAGAKLCLGTRESLQPGLPLLRLLQEQGITHVSLVPSALAALPNEELPTLQNIIVGGEPCPANLVAQWAVGRRFFNAYGPTETTVCATVAQCFEGMDMLPIGRPINNTQIYILDRHLQPLPIGIPGELHIASLGLARGYLKQPNLTEAKFIPNPFCNEPGGRLYKTGDLARYLPDGNIEFLGRIDNQVKIRGFRIELGEIEAALAQHPDVREVVVICREDNPDNQHLVAYVVSNLIPERVPYHSECQVELDGNTVKLHTVDISLGGVGLVGMPAIDESRRVRLGLQLPFESEARWLSGTIAWSRPPQAGIKFQLTPTEQVLIEESVAYQLETQGLWKTLQRTLTGSLRDYLKQKLPDYMIPSAFVLMKALPLTPNGKIDRRALPIPDSSYKERDDYVVAPRTPIEEMLAAIWAEVLGLKRVSINDNFFELGGHSLQAVKLISKLSVEMNVKVSVKLLFQNPTIAELAEALWKLSAPEPSFNQEKPQPKVEETMTASLTKITDPSPFFKLEQRSLLSLFAVGKIAPVDSAALGYLPLSLLKGTSLTRNQVLQNWFDNLPMWDAVMDTKWGRIAVLTLPIFEDELYSDPQKLVQMAVEALEMAGRLGAKTVSLTGLIPSATDYGHAIVKAVEGRTDLPTITTGHATTCSAVVLTIKKILLFSNRSLEQEKVAFIGLGSIGLNTLRLMLKCLPHPSNIILCDVYSKLESIQNIQRELIRVLGFRGSIQIATSTSELPPEIYDATFIIGATNVPDILDIERVKPGTLIVDDSGPHCFSPEQAIKRFEKQKDILFTEGGVLQALHPIETVIHLPEWIKNNLNETLWKEYVPTNPQHIMGCVLSSLLSTRFDYMEPTFGLLNVETCIQHYQGLEQLGFQAADLHCEGYVLPVEPK